MFDKILIANRGEIALRIIRACRELGIRTVAVYSEADRDSLHVRFADEAVCIGPSPSRDSYLNIPRIISAAEITDADAIHPGYGFLAEIAHFSEICASCNIAFIGPPSEVIAKSGDKSEARRTMKDHGVPIIPGSEGVIQTPDEAVQLAREIGYPVILKAVAGGGGRGMRVAHTDISLVKGFAVAQSEAERAFSNPHLYLEKYLERPRHIEFQILADHHGHVIHLGERECSLQRRHQKILEEAPSAVVDENLRKEMGETAVSAAQAVGYRNAGTVEFLLDAENRFYFMEINTRIQVEHPVTEQITNIDLIKEQIAVAAGEPLSLQQSDITIHGHAIECRINAENPEKNFMPSCGRITALHIPGGPGIRVDTHIYAEYVVSPYYDSMLAKVIAWGHTRNEAVARMRRALHEMVIEGIHSTIPFHQVLLDSQQFRSAQIDTSTVDQILASVHTSSD
ncbi:MAG: acetyl-CoA carboxylase biotin carboxylase subunit [bacterium]